MKNYNIGIFSLLKPRVSGLTIHRMVLFLGKNIQLLYVLKEIQVKTILTEQPTCQDISLPTYSPEEGKVGCDHLGLFFL